MSIHDEHPLETYLADVIREHVLGRIEAFGWSVDDLHRELEIPHDAVRIILEHEWTLGVAFRIGAHLGLFSHVRLYFPSTAEMSFKLRKDYGPWVERQLAAKKEALQWEDIVARLSNDEETDTPPS